MANFSVVLLLVAASLLENSLSQQPGGGFGQGGSQFGQGGGQFGQGGGTFGQGGGPFGQGGSQFGQGGSQFGQGGGTFGQGGGPFGQGGGTFGQGGGPFGQGPFGSGGFPGGFPGQGGFFPNFGQNAFQLPQILTCIGTNEATDQLKITLRPEPGSNYLPQPPQQRREFQRQTWRLTAVYISAVSLGHISPPGTTSLVGQLFLAVTKNGRTDGSCAGLGGILQNEDTIFGNDAFQNNPYLQALRNQQNMVGQPAGYIQDPIVISQGGNVYSGVIRDLSEADLRGRGIAICLDYLCQRPTTTCCSIVKDTTPATEQVGPVVNTGPVSGSLLSGAGSTGTSVGALAGGKATGGSGLISGGSASPGGLF